MALLINGSKSELVNVPTINGSTNTASSTEPDGILSYEPFWSEVNEPLELVKLSLTNVLSSPKTSSELLI